MADPINLTDATLGEHLAAARPLMLLLTSGEGLRGDFTTAFKAAADEHTAVTFARLNPAENPAAAARFGAGDKPLLVGIAGGKEVVRRFRPWGTDVAPLVAELLGKAAVVSPIPDETQSMPDKELPPMNDHHENINGQTPIHADDAPVQVTDATFQAEVIDHELPVLVDFWAEWCGPCRQIAPALEKLAKEYAGKVRIAKVNVDENPGLSQTFRIMSIPNIMMIKNRTMVFNQPGALPEPVLRDLINQLVALEVPAPDAEQDAPTEEEPAS